MPSQDVCLHLLNWTCHLSSMLSWGKNSFGNFLFCRSFTYWFNFGYKLYLETISNINENFLNILFLSFFYFHSNNYSNGIRAKNPLWLFTENIIFSLNWNHLDQTFFMRYFIKIHNISTLNAGVLFKFL